MITFHSNARIGPASLAPTAAQPKPEADHAATEPGSAPTAAGGDVAARHNKAPAVGETERALLKQVQSLKNRDREVRQHERAHAAAAAGVPHSPPSYTYTRGPDGQMYATAGEVHIDTSPVAGDPRATLQKAQQIQRAALAPLEPSSADRAVAAQAAAMAANAAAEIQQLPDAVPTAPASEEAAQSGPGSDEDRADAALAPTPAKSGCAVCGGQHSATEHLASSYASEPAAQDYRQRIDLHA